MNESDSRWTEIVTVPDPADWPALVTRCQPFAVGSELDQRRAEARHRLVDAAQQYVLRLHEAAGLASIDMSQEQVLTGDPATQPIVITGHQPTAFHGGLTFKYDWTQQIAARQSAIGIAVVIDTDHGDPGFFQYPRTDEPDTEADERPLQLTEATVGDAPGLYGLVPLSPAAELAERLESVRRDLEAVLDESSLRQFLQVTDDYLKLSQASVTVAEANLIIRRARGIGSQMLELPLSAICCFPEVMHLTADVLMVSESFGQTYNRVLQEYRKSHGISNEANPFPDLQVDDGRTELPFWVMDTSARVRRRLFVREAEGTVTLFADDEQLESCSSSMIGEVLGRLLLKNVQLIPRAALITSFLRLLFADLFVHGTGGGHYDEYTSDLIRAWWHMEPTPFAVASASQYLFEDRRAEIQQLQQLNGRLRDLRYNPQRHFGEGAFPSETEQVLRDLSDRKNAVVAQLKSAKAEGISAKDLGHEIQLISDEMRRVVDDAFSGQLAVLDRLTPDTRKAVVCRTYPWFLLPGYC